MNKSEVGSYITKGTEHKLYTHPTDDQLIVKVPRWYNLVVLNTLSLGHAARTVERDIEKAKQLKEKTEGKLQIPDTNVVYRYRGLSYREVQRRIAEDHSVPDIAARLEPYRADKQVEHILYRINRAPENIVAENDQAYLVDPTLNPSSRVMKKFRIPDKQWSKFLKTRRKYAAKFREKAHLRPKKYG